ncbi:hypothetical protein RCL1_003971 [Eukaryota sp. TZLM3-RCL]
MNFYKPKSTCTDCRREDAVLIEDYRAGYMVCKRCGLIDTEPIIDSSLETRSFSDSPQDAQLSRVGGPIDIYSFGTTLSTQIGEDSKMTKRLLRAGIITGEMKTVKGKELLSRLALKMALPQSMTSRAMQIFNLLQEKTTFRGRNLETITAACLLIACREEGVARTFKEICLVAGLDKKDLAKTYQWILKMTETAAPETISIEDLVVKFGQNCRLDHKIVKSAQEYARKIVQMGITLNRIPSSSAAGLIFFVTKKNKITLTVEDISKVSGVAVSTIKDVYSDLNAVLE